MVKPQLERPAHIPFPEQQVPWPRTILAVSTHRKPYRNKYCQNDGILSPMANRIAIAKEYSRYCPYHIYQPHYYIICSSSEITGDAPIKFLWLRDINTAY